MKTDYTGLGLEKLYDPDIERAVMGTLMFDPAVAKRLGPSLKPDFFYSESIRVMFVALRSLMAKGMEADLLLVTQELRAMGCLEKAGGPYGVTMVAGSVVNRAFVDNHVHVLYELYLRRRMLAGLYKRMREVGDLTQDVFEVIMGVQKDVEEVLERSPLRSNLQDMKSVMKKTCDRIMDRVSRSVNGVTGIPTGIPELDRMTGGWQPGNLIFTAGRPAMGKTQLGLKFAMEAASRGHHVLLFTLEMMSEEVGERLLLMRTPGLYAKVKGGRVTQKDLDELFRRARELDNCPLLVDDKAYLGIDQLCAEARMVHSRYRVDLVVVDYLQLLGVTERAGRNREQEVAECSRKLKALARSLECPVIVASQLNRQVEQTFNQRPELKHLRESGAIEQDADMVLMLCRVDRGSDHPKSGLILAKNRHGEASKPNSCIELELF